MRTKTQGTRRYFSALWSVYALMQVTVAVIILTANDRMPGALSVASIAVMSAIGAGIGFLHGATAMYARTLDAVDAADSGE